jgi:bifunctional enzyme CysN/CysC
MVTGASTADVAVILIDARKGVLTQTRRHSYLVSLIGIRKVVLAINKMDLVDYDQKPSTHRRGLPRLRRQIGLKDITCIPMSALKGDNITDAAQRAHALVPRPDADGLSGDRARSTRRACSSPRSACRCSGSTGPTSISAASAGTIAGGTLRPGDASACSPRAARARSARIVTADGDLPLAVAGQSVTLTLADEIDISRGDVISAPTRRPRWPTSSRPRWSGWPTSPCCPAALPAEDRHAHGHRHGHRAQVQGQRQHAGAPGRQASST